MRRRSLIIRILIAICVLSGMMNMTGCSDEDTGGRIEYDRETGIFTVGDKTFDRDVRELSLEGYGITDISALRHCTQLMCLELDDNNISDISALFGMAELTVLSLSNNNVSNISVLRWLPNLHNLSIDNNPISNYSVISKLEKLVALSVDVECARQGYLNKLSGLSELTLCDNPADGAPSTVDISFLTSYSWFYQLNLRHCIAEDFSVINDLAIYTNPRRSIDVTWFTLEMTVENTDDYVGCGLDSIDTLEMLYIDCQKGTTLDMIAGMDGLRYIELGSGFTTGEDYKWLPETLTDLSAIADCYSLYAFVATGLSGQADMSALYSLPVLKTVSLSGSFEDISFVTGLTQIEELSVTGEFTDISPVMQLNNLNKLGLWGCFNDISAVAELEKLTGITLQGEFSDISAIAALNDLLGVKLRSEKLTDVSVLSGMNSVESLSIESAPIADYGAVGQMPSLKRLFLSGCTIGDLDFIAESASMTYLSMTGCVVKDATVLNQTVGLRQIEVQDTTLNGFDAELFSANNSECSYWED